MQDLMTLVEASLRTPYMSFYSCYWSVNDLAYRYKNPIVPITFESLFPGWNSAENEFIE